MPRALLLLPAILILVLSGGAVAQDDMLLGGLELEVQAGYSGYALPVANSELGREWAEQGPLSWQMAFNYSTVPVRVTIRHRRANAFRGSIELISTAGYSVSEDPLGHSSTVTTDFIVPPSVPYTISLAPRVCPPSIPGGPARLLLRIYQDGMQAPVISEVVTVRQLEPAYLYTLLLDGPPGRIIGDAVNPDNERGLRMPPDFDAVSDLFVTRNWLISCPREQLTGLPLAARDFAFVAADLPAVRQWPEQEQQALVQYMLGGGHVCLYNVDGGRWQGISLAPEALPVGRGYLLLVRGRLDEARGAITDWLAGELEEFTMWCGGRAGGARLPIAQSIENLLAGLDLEEILSASDEPQITSHRPGYLHPVWIYREACRQGALEPWQGPEFLVNKEGGWKYNQALRASVGSNNDNSVDPLAYAASAPRDLPAGWSWLSLLLPGLLLLGGLVRRGRTALLLGGLACFAALGWLWWQTTPPQARPIVLSVVDAEMNVPAATRRSISATETGWGGMVRMELDSTPLVRHISWRDREGDWAAGDWQLELSSDRTQFLGSGGGSYAAVVVDAPAEPREDLPVSLSAHRGAAGNITLEIDSSGLPAGSDCYLLSPAGWLIVPGRAEPVSLELELPDVQVIPGSDRLLAWQRVFSNWYERFNRQGTPMVNETAVLLRHVFEDHRAGKLDTAQYYALLGALQQASGHRGALADQVVLYCLLPDGTTTEASAASVLRLTLSLEGLDE